MYLYSFRNIVVDKVPRYAAVFLCLTSAFFKECRLVLVRKVRVSEIRLKVDARIQRPVGSLQFVDFVIRDHLDRFGQQHPFRKDALDVRRVFFGNVRAEGAQRVGDHAQVLRIHEMVDGNAPGRKPGAIWFLVQRLFRLLYLRLQFPCKTVPQRRWFMNRWG